MNGGHATDGNATDGNANDGRTNDGKSSQARRFGRRTLLASGLAGLSTVGLGLSGDTEPGSATSEPAHRLKNQSNVLVESVHSEARDREVELVTMCPEGMNLHDLPVCLMLHGRFGDARDSAGGLPTWLTTAVNRGQIPPYAFLAVDGGGNSYWHSSEDDDPMWMLMEEVPRWLGERGLGGPDGQPAAVSGISMGGFGALLYARRRQEHGSPLHAAAVVSPALLTSWQEMHKRKAFTNSREWAAIDPLRNIGALSEVPLGVWCGTEDRFIKGTRRFARLAKPEVVSTSPGGHNSRYYRKALPEVVRFVGRNLRSVAS